MLLPTKRSLIRTSKIAVMMAPISLASHRIAPGWDVPSVMARLAVCAASLLVVILAARGPREALAMFRARSSAELGVVAAGLRRLAATIANGEPLIKLTPPTP